MTGTASPDLGVDDVLITAELASRSSKVANYEAEARALGLLAQEMAANPRGVLQKCAELVLELCRADSAGISILEAGGVIRWHAAAGAFAVNLNATMPQEASPCGTVMERNCVLLFHEAERFFPAVREVEPRIYENLLAPWHAKGEAVGTIWAIKHTPEGRFDAEDARILQSLARFTAAAFQMISALDEAAAERAALRESEERHAFLLKLTDALRPLVDAAEIQSTTSNLVGNHLQVDRCMYGEVGGERGAETGTIRGQFVRLGGDDGAIEPFPDRFNFADFGEQTMARRYRGEPLVVSDIDAAPGFEPQERHAWRSAHVCSALVVPLVKKGRLVAEFGVHCTKPRKWTDAEVNLLADVAERTWAAAERARAEAALQESELKYRTLFDNMSQGYSDLELIRDANGRVVNYRYLTLNPAYERLTGLSVAEAVGRTALESLPELENWWLETFERIAKSGEPERLEHQVARLNRWFELFVHPLETDRLSVLYDDISDRKRAELALRESEGRARLLLAELQHRVRNILAMIRSVVTRTASEDVSAWDYSQHLAGRLDAMARTQAILTRRPGDGIEIEDLIRDELLAQAAAEDRLRIEGPPVLLSPKAAEVLTLAIHELATNSIKYGSLGADGELSIAWDAEEQGRETMVRLTWEETGVAISGSPSRRGFGTELITRRVPYELDGSGAIDFGANGLRATIVFPLSSTGSILETGPRREE